MIFDVMNKDELISHVEIIDNHVNVTRYNTHVFYQPFGKDGEVPMARINDFLESRCFERNHSHRTELLQELGLTTYHPIDIVKITHGRMAHDFTWIRFEGEQISWKDVAYATI